jgi:hypothetical protein
MSFIINIAAVAFVVLVVIVYASDKGGPYDPASGL